MAAPRTPLTDAEKDRIRQLHADGATRNDIARDLGRSPAAITGFCQREGLTFNRSATVAATVAKRADAAARRAAIAEKLLDAADRLADQAFAPHEYIDHGGKDFVEVRWTQKEPAPADKLKLIQAAGIALDRHVKLVELDKGTEIAAAASMLGRLVEALGVAYDGISPEELAS